jgi:putative hydrolase of the HAD superfamily
VTRYAAVTLDAMGTLVSIEPPAPRLQRSLERRLGLVVDLARCEGAMRVEMRHYRAHCVTASDAPSLAALRLDCACLVADALALEVPGADVLPSLTDAIAFQAYSDALPALECLAAAGLKLAVIANWDVSLPDVLARLGLAGHFEAIVTAAGVGAAKPDPRPFRAALARLGVEAGQCLHVGDDLVTDVEGARAAGLAALLLDRGGGAPDSLADLSELPAHVGVAA